MSDLFFYTPTQTVFGVDAINRLGLFIAPFGKRALLVTEGILYMTEILNRVTGLLERKNIETIVYDDITPNATSRCVDQGVKLARGAKIEIVIGLGGVKTLSIAKCIAMTAPGRHEMDDYLSDKSPEGTPLVYIEIPTTARNPFTFTNEYFVIDARERKGKLGTTQPGITKVALIDSQLSASLPPKYLYSTFLETLLCASEGFISTKANFLSDAFFSHAIEALRDVFRLLQGATAQGRQIGQTETGPVQVNANPLEEHSENAGIPAIIDSVEQSKIRQANSKAGFLTALGLTTSTTGLGMALVYALRARYFVSKSLVAALLLPHIWEFHFNASADRIAEIGRWLGLDTAGLSLVEAAKATIQAVRICLEKWQLPKKLKELGIQIDDLVEIAEAAQAYPMINFLPRRISSEDLYELLKAIL